MTKSNHSKSRRKAWNCTFTEWFRNHEEPRTTTCKRVWYPNCEREGWYKQLANCMPFGCLWREYRDYSTSSTSNARTRMKNSQQVVCQDEETQAFIHPRRRETEGQKRRRRQRALLSSRRVSCFDYFAFTDPCVSSFSTEAEGGSATRSMDAGDGAGDGTTNTTKPEPPTPPPPTPMAPATPPITATSTITTATEESSYSSNSNNSSSSAQSKPQSTVAGLAKEAAQLFHARSYQGCLLILHQLQLHNDEDPKIRHNIAVAEYYRDGCTNPEKLLDVLSQVKARNEELARAAEEQQEGNSSASTSGSTNGSGGNNGGLSSAARTMSADVVTYMEDYDTSIPNLNNAITQFHMHRYAAAMSILEPLYRNIEPIDETAALRVCLLMLDIALAFGRPGLAAEVLQYMEKAFGYLLPPSETSSTVPATSSSTPSETELLITSTEQQNLARTSSDEVLEEEPVVLGSLEIAAREPPVVAAREKPVLPAVDVKLLLHLYRVRFFLSARNLKASKREVKAALNLNRENVTALLLKAQMEYSRGKYKKASKQLNMCIQRADPGVRAMVLCNLGCVHHRQKKHQVAAVYFRESLKLYQIPDRSESPLSVQTFSQDRSLPVFYNAGLQQLIIGKDPVVAFKCFQNSASLYFNRPLLWLRLAECCIVALEMGLLENTTATKEKVEVKVIGEGEWRRAILPAGSQNPTLFHGRLPLNMEDSDGSAFQIPEGTDTWFTLGRTQKLSLSFAIKCLQTALCLFDRNDARAAEAAAEAAVAAAEAGDSGDGGVTSPTAGEREPKGLVSAVAAYDEHKAQETAALRMWALAALSYCHLGVGHPLRALRSAEKLLRQPACARPYMLLAHMYAAEALCMCARLDEALEHLSTCLSEATAEPMSSGVEDESKWKSGDNSEASVDGEDAGSYTVGALGDAASVERLTGSSARVSLLISLVAVYSMQGSLDEAQRLATEALKLSPSNATAFLAAVYVEMKLERTEAAMKLLKDFRHLCVVSSSPSKGLPQL